MIDVEPLSQNEWLVTVKGQTTTEHRVRVTPEEVRRLAGEKSSTPQLLEASFRFLLERESNTSILSSFDLLVIGRYFPEYETEIRRYLTGG
ncbi:conserved hypothetical protein [Chthoniobacter flavus Ellin428]|uniref:Uncharacterized protein n=1 Tax=Chthoniobacter flavus Ellin428 TaxID=497964 RepID=B4CUN6_9BACT|nr:hypothetical protein [Chthoniobacter flavus]EDY22274.1 conserved hypothetical protein [Chthoniobacter flavus Ellin428]TCO94707.1 hypothetical protein EV701_102176 [Chthoniobacter flavus]